MASASVARCYKHTRYSSSRDRLTHHFGPRTGPGRPQQHKGRLQASSDSDKSVKELAKELLQQVKDASNEELRRNRGSQHAVVTCSGVLLAIMAFVHQNNLHHLVTSFKSYEDVLSKLGSLVVANLRMTGWDAVSATQVDMGLINTDMISCVAQAALTHANLLHLWIAASATLTAGTALEVSIGPGRLLCLAALAAYTTCRTNVVVLAQPLLGLTGVASALIAAVFVGSLWRKDLQGAGRQVFTSTLWLVALGLFLPSIDHRVHIIGFVTGVLGVMLLDILPPLHEPLLTICASLSTFVLMLVCGFGVLRHVPRIM